MTFTERGRPAPAAAHPGRSGRPGATERPDRAAGPERPARGRRPARRAAPGGAASRSAPLDRAGPGRRGRGRGGGGGHRRHPLGSSRPHRRPAFGHRLVQPGRRVERGHVERGLVSSAASAAASSAGRLERLGGREQRGRAGGAGPGAGADCRWNRLRRFGFPHGELEPDGARAVDARRRAVPDTQREHRLHGDRGRRVGLRDSRVRLRGPGQAGQLRATGPRARSASPRPSPTWECASAARSSPTAARCWPTGTHCASASSPATAMPAP